MPRVLLLPNYPIVGKSLHYLLKARDMYKKDSMGRYIFVPDLRAMHKNPNVTKRERRRLDTIHMRAIKRQQLEETRKPRKQNVNRAHTHPTRQGGRPPKTCPGICKLCDVDHTSRWRPDPMAPEEGLVLCQSCWRKVSDKMKGLRKEKPVEAEPDDTHVFEPHLSCMETRKEIEELKSQTRIRGKKKQMACMQRAICIIHHLVMPGGCDCDKLGADVSMITEKLLSYSPTGIHLPNEWLPCLSDQPHVLSGARLVLLLYSLCGWKSTHDSLHRLRLYHDVYTGLYGFLLSKEFMQGCRGTCLCKPYGGWLSKGPMQWCRDPCICEYCSVNFGVDDMVKSLRALPNELFASQCVRTMQEWRIDTFEYNGDVGVMAMLKWSVEHMPSSKKMLCMVIEECLACGVPCMNHITALMDLDTLASVVGPWCREEWVQAAVEFHCSGAKALDTTIVRAVIHRVGLLSQRETEWRMLNTVLRHAIRCESVIDSKLLEVLDNVLQVALDDAAARPDRPNTADLVWQMVECKLMMRPDRNLVKLMKHTHSTEYESFNAKMGQTLWPTIHLQQEEPVKPTS